MTVAGLLSVGLSSTAFAQPATRPTRPVATFKVGDEAPDFTLKTLDGKETVTLSSFEGKKPVALVFGSYT